MYGFEVSFICRIIKGVDILIRSLRRNICKFIVIILNFDKKYFAIFLGIIFLILLIILILKKFFFLDFNYF